MVSKGFIITIIFGILAVGTGIYFTKSRGNKPEILDKLKQFIQDLIPFDFKSGLYTNKVDKDDTGSDSSLKQVFNIRKQHDKIFTKQELSKYDGSEGSNVYLAILGHVYDVEKGRRKYGPGSGYHFFTGKDGTKAFISGDFTDKGLIEDTSELTPADMLGIKEWLEFYEKDYKFVGLLEGLYYDANGKATQSLLNAEERIKLGLKLKKSEAEEKQEFPPCNSQWTKKGGSRVWCTKKSGGIKRDWIGVPRKLYKAGSTDFRCACIKQSQLNNPLLKEYDDCDPKADACRNKTT